MFQSIQQLQPPTKSVLLQKFRNLSFLSLAEAKFYMEESEWDVDRALDMWRADRDWEREQVSLSPRVVTRNPPGDASMPVW